MTALTREDTLDLAATKAPLALGEAWRALRRAEPLGFGSLYLTVCNAWTEAAVASAWACSPTRVRRELACGLGWLALWTDLEPAEILERLRAGEVAA